MHPVLEWAVVFVICFGLPMVCVFMLGSVNVRVFALLLSLLILASFGAIAFMVQLIIRKNKGSSTDPRPQEAEHEDVSTPSVTSSTGPPKYDQLYPDKIVISPSIPNNPVPSSFPLEPTLYVNPYSQSFSQSSFSWQMESSEEQDQEGLPSYAEAVLLAKTVQP